MGKVGGPCGSEDTRVWELSVSTKGDTCVGGEGGGT